MFVDKTKVNNCCDLLSVYTTQIRFLKTRTKFKEEYKQFIREAKRTVKVVKEYLKKITKLADEITVVELKLNAEEFSKEPFDSNRYQHDLFEDALDYRKKFLKYLQNQDYFNDIKGLIWRLDYDVSKQQYFYIFHIFFYILGDKHKKIMDIDYEWKKITNNKGSLEYLEGADQEGYFFDKLDLTNVENKERLIKSILAYYERDIFGHVRTHGKKGISFSKKVIVPVGHNNLKERLKESSKRFAAKAEEWLNQND